MAMSATKYGNLPNMIMVATRCDPNIGADFLVKADPKFIIVLNDVISILFDDYMRGV